MAESQEYVGDAGEGGVTLKDLEAQSLGICMLNSLGVFALLVFSGLFIWGRGDHASCASGYACHLLLHYLT